MRLAAYVRVSTDKQAEHGQGLAVQEKAIRTWAKANGHRIVAVCKDEGISGTKDTAERPGLAEAVTTICATQATGLVVHRLDRLARSLHVQEGILAHVWQCGGAVYAVDSGEVLRDDPEDPMRTFVRQVMGAAAELERSMLVVRLRQGRRHKRQEGGYADGAPPFGYRTAHQEPGATEPGERKGKGSVLVEHEGEQQTLARMRALRAEGLSLQTIADALNAEGLPAKRGGRWHSAAVGRVLGRPAVSVSASK